MIRLGSCDNDGTVAFSGAVSSTILNHLNVSAKPEFAGMGGLEYDPSIFVELNEMLASSQFVALRRAASSRENASVISSCSEGLSLSVGADFSGKPRTFRLC